MTGSVAFLPWVRPSSGPLPWEELPQVQSRLRRSQVLLEKLQETSQLWPEPAALTREELLADLERLWPDFLQTLRRRGVDPKRVKKRFLEDAHELATEQLARDNQESLELQPRARCRLFRLIKGGA